MFIIIPGAFNAQVGVPGGGQQGQVVTVGSILRVIERDRRPYPTDVGTPSDIWIDNTSGIGYICKEFDTGHGTVWDRLDLLGDFVTFGDNDPGVNIDIKLGYRPGSLRYARNSEILWICKDNTQGAAVWDVLSSGGSVVSVNGLTGVVQLYLDDILDVSATTPADGDVLTWDSATSNWIAATGVGTTYTANNGLTAAPGNIFQLGGTLSGTGNLIRDTYITNDNYIFRIDQTGTAKSALYLSHLGTGANYGVGLTVQVADGRSIRASSTGDVVFEGVSQADYTAELIRNTATTTGIEGILKLARGSSGVPAPDIGGSIDFWIKARTTTPFPGLNTAAPTEPTVRLVGLWENPGYAIMSRLSRFDIYGFKNNDTIKNASVTGNGKFTLYQYGQTPAAFLDTPVWSLGVNADGDVIEFDGGGGPSTPYTVNSGLSIDSADTYNFQLGATTNLLSPLLHDTYINLDNYAFHINGGPLSTYNLLIDKPGVSKSEITIDNSSFNLQSTDIVNNRVIGLDITNGFNGAASLRRTDLNGNPDIYNGFYILGDKTGWNVTDGATQYQYELPPAGTGYKVGALTDKLGNGKLSWETVSSGGLEYAIASGTNAYVVTIAGVTAYTDGDIYSIKFTNGNTAASTITINGVTPAQHLHKSVSTSLASGDIISGQVLIIQYDGSNFQVIGIAGGTGNLPTGGTAGQILEKIDSANYNVQWANNVSSIQHIQQNVKNNQGVPVSKGQAVYINGADGTNATIKLAQADTELTSSKTLGLLEQDLNNNAKGFVITEGLLSGLDTSAANIDGDPVWLSPTTPGGLVYGIANKPSAPSHLVFIGIVIRKNANNGEIYVKVQNGFELKELHDVQAQSPALKDTLYFDNTVTPNQWKTAQASTLLPTSFSKGSVGVVFDGADGVITANTVAYVQVPYNGTITAWTIVSKPTAVGTCTVTAFKLSSYPPTTPTNNIFNTQPALTGIAFNQDLTPDFVPGKDIVTAGDWIGFRITVPVTVTWVNLTLSITKT